MVFEHLAVFFLDKYLGDYFENLDSKKLKIDLWHGDVTLENLYLKSNTLNELNLPFTITTGYLKNVSIHIPWKHLYSHPTKIHVDGVYLLLGPKTEVNCDLERVEKDEYDAKMKQVNKIEQFRKKREDYEKSQKSPEHKDTFLERLQFHIMRHLELSISNIHICYQDNVTKPSNPFRFGLTLSYIKLHTTNEDWEDVNLKEDSTVIYKFAEVNNLSIYWNSNIKIREDLTNKQICEDLKLDIDNDQQKIPSSINYILKPLNGTAKLKLAKTANKQDYQRPVLDAKIDFEEINLNINRNQYSDLLDLLEYQDYMNMKSKYIKYYSMIDDNQTDKPTLKRWKFAYTVILNENVRPRLTSFKWENIKENLLRYKEYHKLYLQELTHQAGKQEKKDALELEKKIDLFNLIYIRRTVQIQVKKKKLEKKEMSWWERITNWWSPNSFDDNPKFNFDDATSMEEKSKFYQAIGYDDEHKSSSPYPEEYIDIDISLELNLIELNVWSNTKENQSKMKVIARLSLPYTDFKFQRRPANQDFLFQVDLDSLEMSGNDSKSNGGDQFSLSRPILIQPFNQSELKEEKLLHIYFESNPLDTKSDYHIKAKSKLLLITYHAETVNNLIQCFLPDRHHDLEGIKQAALSIYTDIKHWTQFLLNENLKKIKDLDADIDLQSIYFILPQNGSYTDSSPIICLDSGNLTFKSERQINKNILEEEIFEDAKDNTDHFPYVPLKIQLENVQLLYLNQNEDWKEIRLKEDSKAHLIKPIAVTLDINKSIYTDDPQLPIWKVDGEISPILSHISDSRLLGSLKLIQSIPLPESNQKEVDGSSSKKKEGSPPNTKQTFETIENSTPVKKLLHEQEVEDQKQIEVKQQPSQEQITQLQASLQLSKIDILIEQSLLEFCDYNEPFIRLSIESIITEMKIKTFDVEFRGSIQNLIVVHESFVRNENDRLHLISRQNDENFFSIDCLLTSSTNPLFGSSPYNHIENQINVKLAKTLLNLQLEALSSIIEFKNNIFKNLSKENPKEEEEEEKGDLPKPVAKVESKSKVRQSSFKLDFNIEEIFVLIGNEFSQLLFVQLKSFNGKISKTNLSTSAHILLNDFRVIDPHPNSRFDQIIVKEKNSNDLLVIDLSLFNFSKKREQQISHLKGQLEKLNIIFLYKHINLILNIINGFKSKQTQKQKTSSPSDQSNSLPTIPENYKLDLDLTLNAPQILIPINSFSNEAIFIDLGKIRMRTDSSHEQYRLAWKNLLSNRVKLNNHNEIQADINLLECSQFKILINQNSNDISIKLQWDTMEFKLGKDDYATIIKILKENFKENIYYQFPQIQLEQNFQEQSSDKVSIEQAKDTNEGKSTQINIRFDLQIKQIGLTIFIDQINLENLQTPRNENSKFIYFTIQLIEANFESTNSNSNGKLEIQNILLENLQQKDQQNTISTLINKHLNVEQNIPIFIATLKMNSKDKTSHRKVNGQMESFYICISPQVLTSLQKFLSSNEEIKPKRPNKTKTKQETSRNNNKYNLPLPAKSISQRQTNQQQSKEEKQSNQTKTIQQSSSHDVSSGVETSIDLEMKSCQLIIVEDQNNLSTDCLVLGLSLKARIILLDQNTKVQGSVKDLACYGSNFDQLKNFQINYDILQNCQIEMMMIINPNEQKIDLNIGDISIVIDPQLIHTIISLSKLMGDKPTDVKEEKEKINSKSIFNPKPFKDSTFWFIEDPEEKEEMIEETDILELTTGSPSQKKILIDEKKEEKEKEKEKEKKKNLSQQLILNLKIIEVKLELGSGKATKPVIAICLSNLFGDIKNWSSDIIVSSTIEVELALFNDHLLTWEPLIEPIIDERGVVQSPWAINCQTITDYPDDNEEKSRFLLQDEKEKSSSSSSSDAKEKKESGANFDIKKVFSINADYILNVTLTKTTLNLAQRLSTMFNDAYKSEVTNADDQDESLLIVHNQTGYHLLMNNIHGVQLLDEEEKSKESIEMDDKQTVRLTVPDERLAATHLPAISEQVAKRKQGFTIKINDKEIKVDVNQTWRRVYEIGPSSILNWPMQMLCDSQIFEDQRRVVLSSIIKISNRTQMPLIILDADSIEKYEFNRKIKIEVDQEYYLPIDLLYSRTSSRLYFAIDQENSQRGLKDFISFDWINESSSDRVLKMLNGKEAHYVVYKEEIEAYSENTDEPIRKSFNIYIKLALHLINLLPIDIQCSIDNIENVDLKPSELYHSTSGNKKSILIFTIPSYNNSKWISDPIDLNVKGHGTHNEHIVVFHDVATKEILRMVLRVNTYRQSYRASFYSPFWIVNTTDLKFEFKTENDKWFVDVVDQPYFICPKKFDSESHKKKGHIRLYSIEEEENISQWSESFSLDVIKSTGMTTCKVAHDRDYMVCVDIVTCSFGMTQIVTLVPSMAIINNSSSAIEVVECVDGKEQDDWKSVKTDQIISYWPRNIKDDDMRVRYAGNISSADFAMNDKHRTLLRINDEDRPAIHVEVTITDYDGIRIVFGDYKIGDAPLLIVNSLTNQSISFSQKDDLRTQILPPQYYVYYTWMDPFKPREVVASSNGESVTIQLNPACGVLEKESDDRIYYATFHDGPQTVLIFSSETSIIESVSDLPSLGESLNKYIQLSLNSIGIAIVDDINREDLFYITINQSKEIWTETRKSNIKPLPPLLNEELEHFHKKYLKQNEQNSNEKQNEENKYEIDKNRSVTFDEDEAEISDNEDHKVHVKRQCLDGLWFGYAFSSSNMAIHLRINDLQIDNQLKLTMFPTILHPIVSKSAGTDIPGKAFIELSVFKTISTRSNTIHFKYFKLLIQEFVASVDQGLIVAIMAFAKPEKNPSAPRINMDTDLQRISKPLETIIKSQTDNTSGETKFYFDNLHLSPLKIHVSFSMHGAEADDQLLAEYPLADFLLQILNVAEVQDVILKLNFYERKNDRFTIPKLTQEIGQHYENQFLKQLHVVVLGLDVLGNPFGVVRGVAKGVETLFYEPYQGAMEGPVEFLEGLATGTRFFLGSVVGGAAGALSKVTGAASKGLATLTLDEDYQNARIQRKELAAPTTPELVSSGKNTLKDVMLGVKGVFKKPIKGAKQGGGKGFIKGLGKGFIGLIARPTSGVADLTSTSLNLVKRVATHEQIIHRIRHPCHVGRDGIVRPSLAHEAMGVYIFDRIDHSKHDKTEGYIAHIDASLDPPSWFFVTTKRVLFFTESSSSSNSYETQWDYHYKEIKGEPTVKFEPNYIEITLKETNLLGMTKKDSIHVKVVPYQVIGEARYIVDKIIEVMKALET